MPRKLKPYKVDHVYDGKLRVRVEIMFDREDKVFFAELDTERVQASTVDECRKLAREMIPRAVKMEWKPYILVDGGMEHDFRYNSHGVDGHVVELRFGFSRLEAATNLQGRMIERPHVLDWSHKDQERRTSDCHRAEELIPYTAEMWASLEALRGQIEQAGKRLAELVEDRANLPARLAHDGGSVLLLPAAPTEQPRRRKVAGR
jgi:hypothetical protein